GDVAALATAGAVYLAPMVFKWNEHLPSCGSPTPCDPATLPGVDRWALTGVRPRWDDVSTVLLVAGAVGVWSAEADGGALGRARLVASLEAASWAAASSEMIKVAVARKRPVLYSSGSFIVAADMDNQRSFPSTHAAIAFALATSYALDRGALGQTKDRAIALFILATGVGALRVVAGKHFPTDVAAGAALGVTNALVVHVIKF
ncbi:MAG TPA: phosphatase PAP2 family protein, partial [Gemmatimonadales bacterium]